MLPIPVFRPSYDEREEQAVIKVLRSGWIGLGPVTEAIRIRIRQESRLEVRGGRQFRHCGSPHRTEAARYSTW